MPSKKKNTKTAVNEFDEDYRRKRERNNQAVKKSREKTKQNTIETHQRVEKLRVENKVLENEITNLKKKLKLLKELFIAQAKAKNTSAAELKDIIGSDTESEDDKQMEEDDEDDDDD
ncbi:CCAAT/enhancer-binding protein homolog 2 [Lutzomyia longipalpis]|uniref:CCAAT/enhancer-binding protein homolog 2 n=1 Tax=Lutzomyia longipalpis TaxID=7200 RepID=UPI0024839CA3|nr:CCAAT/enhancer-binding protein homolog 2 [Lutzomyia longipalpis]